MANGYGSGYGSGYGYGGGNQAIASGTTELANAIARMGVRHRQTQNQLQTVQGYLNIAKQAMTTDPKTGKQKPFFSPDQIQQVQSLLDQHNAFQAGAAAAALGIGKNVAGRVAAANNAAQIAANPTTTINGGTYLLDKEGIPKAGVVMPRNIQTGMTYQQQLDENLKQRGFDQNSLAKHNAGVNQMLKQNGVTRAQLFDPTQVQPGTITNGQFVPINANPATTPSPSPTPQGSSISDNAIAMMTGLGFGGASAATPTPAPQGSPTHYLVGQRSPTFVQQPGVKTVTNPDGSSTNIGADGKPTKYITVDKGDPGKVMSIDQFQALQDSVARGGAPMPGNDGKLYSPEDALAYIRSPEADPKLAESIRQSLIQSVTGRSTAGSPSAPEQPQVEHGTSGTSTTPAAGSDEDTGNEND